MLDVTDTWCRENSVDGIKNVNIYIPKIKNIFSGSDILRVDQRTVVLKDGEETEPGQYYAHSKKGVEKTEWQLLKQHLINTANIAKQFGEDAGVGEL
jgi:hypothetical protein